MAISLKAIVNRLNDTTRKAVEDAAGLCLARTHYNVEIEHFLIGLLDKADTDLAAILRRWEIEPARLLADLTRSLDRMKTGNARAPMLSEDLSDLMREAWPLASLEYNEGRIRSAAVA